MIIYKDVLKRLAEAGYSAYRLQRDGIISGSTLDRIRKGLSISTNTIDTICSLCNCQPEDIILYKKEKGED